MVWFSFRKKPLKADLAFYNLKAPPEGLLFKLLPAVLFKI